MGFIEDYFIRPLTEHSGYNIVNTATYAIILIVSLFVIYKILIKMKIKFDKNLFLSLLPFVFIGGALRALKDVSFFDFLGVYHILFATPFIYILVFLLAFFSLIISKYLWEGFIKYFGVILLVISIIPVIFFIKDVNSAFIILFVAFLSYAVVYFVLKCLKIKILSKSYSPYLLLAHLFDASTAFVAVSVIGGYKESGIFTSFFFSEVPGFFFIPVKALIILVVLYFINKENSKKILSEDEINIKWFLMFSILVLGLGPGLHNFFSILMGSAMM